MSPEKGKKSKSWENGKCCKNANMQNPYIKIQKNIKRVKKSLGKMQKMKKEKLKS